MPNPGARQLRLSDWLVLCVVCKEPTHGFAVAGLFSREGSLRRVWQFPSPQSMPLVSEPLADRSQARWAAFMT